jgi:Rrf2 family protein
VVNQQFAFGLHVLAMLAYSGGIIDSRTIAASVNTNPVVVRRLLLALRRAGLVETISGKRGGARLAKKPNQISLLDVYDAVNTQTVIAVSQRAVIRKCPVSCGMKHIMMQVSRDADSAMRGHLRGIKMSALLRKIRSV